MYKKLFILLFDLIVHPEKAWKHSAEKQDEDNEEFYKGYLYPIWGIIALLSFIGVFLSLRQFEIQIALKTMIKAVLTYFITFYCASWGLSKMIRSYFHIPVERIESEQFVGYSSVAIYLTAMLLSLFPSLFYFQIFIFYTIYIIWEGAIFYLKLDENDWVKFTIFASILIIALPFLIGFIISLIMPGLK